MISVEHLEGTLDEQEGMVEMPVDSLIGWMQILLPTAGATALLLMKISRLQAEIEFLKATHALLLNDTKELLRRDVYNALQEAMEARLVRIDVKLDRLEKKIYNGGS